MWVRIEGHTYNLTFIAVYVPHKYRTAPSQAETLQEINTLCRTLWHKYLTDQLIVAGDMNGKIPRNVKPIPGKFAMHPYADSGGERLIEVMHNNHLHAASTRFCPPRSHACGQGTYISPHGGLNQLECILCSNEHADKMTSCRVLVYYGIYQWTHTQTYKVTGWYACRCGGEFECIDKGDRHGSIEKHWRIPHTQKHTTKSMHDTVLCRRIRLNANGPSSSSQNLAGNRQTKATNKIHL